MDPKDITYKIMENEETGERQYFLDDEPWKFVDPKHVQVGSMIWFDPNGLDRCGVVIDIRQGDFTYYDVVMSVRTNDFNSEEIAMFQVFKVQNGEEIISNEDC